LRFSPLFAVLLFVTILPAQERGLASLPMALPSKPEPQNPPASPLPQLPATQNSSNNPAQATPGSPSPSTSDANSDEQPLNPQPERILGVMPNFRAVSAGAIPPPPTPKESFIIASKNSFDYSAFLFNGFTSLEAIGADAHPELGKGVAGYGRYYWRGFIDRTDGNYFVILILPTILHQDERYYAMGKGGFWKRTIYSASRVLITPNYEGHNTFNASEIFGRGIAQAISVTYYPPSPAPLGPSRESTVSPLEETRSLTSSVNSGPTSQSTSSIAIPSATRRQPAQPPMALRR
jgi:hypothetical protein